MIIAAHNGAHVWGGAERGTALILAGLRARGHEVLLFCNDAAVAARAEQLGVPTAIGPLHGDLAVWDAVRLAVKLRRLQPDVLLLGTFKKIWLGALAGRLAGVPRIVVRIGLESDTPRRLKYRVVMRRWVDIIVLKADDVRGRYRAALPGFAESRLVTIPGGTEPRPRLKGAGAVRAELGIDDNAMVIGAVARLASQKRLDRLLHALSALPPDVTAMIAGDGPEQQMLAALARSLGLGDRVRFLGERDDIGDVLAALNLFIVTSSHEMLSFAMLEALAAGVPVVSTPVSGAAEALAPLPDGRRPGLLLSSFETGELTAEVRTLIADRTALAQMGGAAAERARTAFSYSTMLDRWEHVLDSHPDADVRTTGA
jgi:glycosyltransferase involved in cell wall biosynthesis